MADTPVGRFAPSPTGRMHLGNIFTALLSWLSVKARGGRWILRIEDLDPQRSRLEYARQIEDDLLWLGLPWDEGGIDGKLPAGPYLQSQRHQFYEDALARLEATGRVYRCTCRRADIHAVGAPHASDGRIIYNGRCRPKSLGGNAVPSLLQNKGAWRLFVSDETIVFADVVYGLQNINLAREFGDFLLRRADGAWAYQLAVVADDALMGVTEIVRGHDLLSSAAPQIYLYHLLGYQPPVYAHVPLICNTDGIRLSKRDTSLSMEALRLRYEAPAVIGHIAHLAGIIPAPDPVTPSELLSCLQFRTLSTITTLKSPSILVPSS